MYRMIPVALTVACLSLGLTSCANARIENATITFEPYDEAPAKSALALPDIDIPFEKHVLPNGLTLIIHEDHKAPIVAVNVWYHVGSKDEKPGKTGFAHLFEHLMFNGSENYNDEFFRPLEKVGATDMNGTTNVDRTNYFQNVPKSALDLVLWMESDRMGNLLGAVDQKKLDEQRGVVQNEKRQGENQPYGKAWEQIAAGTYPAGHPYSWTTIGSMDDLNAAKLADVHEWFKQYYGAANAVVVVAGDVEPVAVRQRIEHYFGGIPAGPVLKKQQAWIAPMQGERRMTLQDRVPQARLYKVWNAPGYADVRAQALLDLAGERLGSGKTSLLYERLVYKDQIATDVNAGLYSKELGSQFLITATAKPGQDLKKVEQAIDEELARFLREGPGADPLNRIKTYTFANYVRGIERIGGFGGKSDVLASSQVYYGDAGAYRDYLHELREARPDTVRDAARQWLSGGVFALEVHPFPERKTTAVTVNRKQLPDVGPSPALDLPDFQRATLSNGLKLVLAERHEAPIVQFGLLLDGGYATDNPAKPGVASFTLSMLMEGTAKRDALAISARADELGANLGTDTGMDTFSVSLSALTPRLNDSLELYADVIRNSTLPEKEVERLRALRLAGIQREKVSPGGLLSRNLRRLVYGADHPYALSRGGLGTEESVTSTTAEDLRAHYRRWLRPDSATLVIVGDTTLKVITPLLEKHLGGWRAPADAPVTRNLPAVSLPAKPRVFLINRTDAEQTLIVAANLAPPRQDPDHIPMLTVNEILGGMFTARLNMNLREDKHWSYGASSGLSSSIGPRLFSASASVQRDKTAPSMLEILKELRDIAGRKPFAPKEIAAAQDSLTLSLPGDNETTGEVTGSINNLVLYGLPDNYYDTLVGKIRSLTNQELAAAAKRLVYPDALTWLVIGDLAKVEAPVRKLGLGEVKVLDADGVVLR